MRFPHTRFARGIRLRIVLMDGTVMVRRFHERLAKAVVVTDEKGVKERLPKCILKNLTIYKGSNDARAVRPLEPTK